MIASSDECAAFASQVNSILEPYRSKSGAVINHQDYLPVQAETLLGHLRDGVILGHLLDNLAPGCLNLDQLVPHLLSEQEIDDPTTIFKVTANLNLVIGAAKSLRSLVVVNLGAQDILDANEDLVLGLLWQLLRATLLAKVNIASHAELVRLLLPGESLATFSGLRPEAILLRWFNYHLGRSGAGRIENFGGDLADGRLLECLLKQIYGYTTDNGSVACGQEERASNIFKHLRQVGVDTDGIEPAHLISGHPRMNLMLVAKIFNHRIGIHLPSEEECRQMLQQRDQLLSENAALADQLGAIQSQLALLQEAQSNQAGMEVQLRAIKEEKARELDQVQCEFRAYKDDLAQTMQARLQQRIQEETQRHQEERHHLLDRLYELSTAVQSTIALVSPHVNGEAVLREQKIRPCGAGEEPSAPASSSSPASCTGQTDDLARGLTVLVRALLTRLAKLEETNKTLRNDLDAKTMVNEVMGQKIREYTENLIQAKKANAELVPVNSPLSRLTRMLSTTKRPSSPANNQSKLNINRSEK